MRHFAIAVIAAGLLSVGLPAQAQGASSGAQTFGVWSNPKGSVHVEIKPCGAGACGYVVWANDKAKRDAREGGTQNLVGLQVFRDLELDRNGVWRGKVFAPDMNRTFSGTAQQIDATRLRAKGCVLGGLICKSQVWTRVV